MDLTGLSSSCLSNSGCLGLSGLNLTDCGGGGGGLVGLGGLVHGFRACNLVHVSGLGVLVLG